MQSGDLGIIEAHVGLLSAGIHLQACMSNERTYS
jgi:hypothetical protein